MARVATARRPLTVEYDFHGKPLRSDAASGEGAGCSSWAMARLLLGEKGALAAHVRRRANREPESEPSSSGQRSDDRRRVVVAIVRGFGRPLGVVGMETEDVIRDPLRIGRGMEDLALVLLENVE